MMAASLLRFYEELVDIIRSEPLGEFSDHKSHCAISTILKTAGNVGLTEEDIITWSREIRHDFISKNWLAMPMSVIGETIGPEHQESPMAKMFVDARPVLTTMQDMSNALAVNNTMCVHLKEQVKELEGKVEEQGKMLETKLNTLIGQHDEQTPESRKRSAENSSDDASSKKVCKFVEIWVALEHKLYSDPKLLLFNWYDSDIQASFDAINTQEERNRVRPKKCRIHAIVKKLLEHGLDEKVDNLNEKPQDIVEYAKWKSSFITKSELAYSTLISKLDNANLLSSQQRARPNDIKNTTLTRLIKTFEKKRQHQK